MLAPPNRFDSRDMLIDKISELVEVTTTIDAQGRATLRLGTFCRSEDCRWRKEIFRPDGCP